MSRWTELPARGRVLDSPSWPGRRAIAEATFDRLDVLGLDVIATPSSEANQYGWGEAFGRGPLEVPLVCLIAHSGRGERSSRGHTIQLSIRIEPQPVMNIPSYVRRSSEIA